MKKFAVATIAAAANAQEWESFEITQDGLTKGMFSQSKEFSIAYIEGKSMEIMGNNSLSIQEAQQASDSSAYKPNLMGGSIEYDVSLGGVNSGCVAGVYLVESDNSRCSPNESQDQKPQCKSIDAMQANKYGFESKAHPCSNGTCDAISQCALSMQHEAIQSGHQDCYGPGGSKIDTNKMFHVKNEYVSTTDYANFWKLRTIISQDDRQIVMEKDCRDYLVGLQSPISGDMSIVFSSWDNLDGGEDFELDNGQSKASTCSDAVHVIQNFTVNKMGSTEDPKDDADPNPNPDPNPDPEPQPESVIVDFEAYTDYYGGDWKLHALGLEGVKLEGQGDMVTMGYNNRAWVLDYPSDETTYWSYWHDYLGGTIEFDVNLASTGCQQAAGMYLVQADDENCSWKAKSGGDPQCARVELMEANTQGFKTASFPCESGSCADFSDSTAYADFGAYGPGPQYEIDSTRTFTVETRFFAMEAADGTVGDLKRIETTLIQGANQISIIQDDAKTLSAIQDKLRYSMAVVMTNFNAGETNDISGVCDHGGEHGDVKFSGMRWTSYDSIDNTEDGSDGTDGDGELIVDEVASSLDMCSDDFCSACHMAHYSNNPNNRFPTCTDYTRYKFTNQCGNKDSSMCGSDDVCFRSYPADDKKKNKSDDFACRPIPVRMLAGEFNYSRRQTRNMRKGLCALGCEGTCHNSYPVGDADKWKSSDAIWRCKA